MAFFVARVVLRLTALPSGLTYAVSRTIGVLVGYRAWSTRVCLRPGALRIHHAPLTTTVPIDTIGRGTDHGRVETRRPTVPRTTALPADALPQPWWVFGRGHSADL